MKQIVRIVPMIGAAIALAAAAAHGQSAADLQRLQGNWQMVSGEHNGVPLAADVVKKSGAVWGPNKMLFILPGAWTEPIQAAVTLNSPDIQWVESNGPNRGGTNLGILEIAGDTYRVCFDPKGKTRPTSFRATAGSGYVLYVFRRLPG